MRVIFLDIDGVLNSSKFLDGVGNVSLGSAYFDRKAVKVLNKIVDLTGAVIVISSSWRRIFSLSTLKRFLKESGFKGKVIGKTPAKSHDIRGLEIKEWLDRPENESIVSFAILDDDSNGIENLRDHFVQTDWETGLQSEHAELAVRMLMNGSQN